MGYCNLYKIPKLRKAIANREIRKVSLLNLKKTWVPIERKFMYSASLTILKSGKWHKDDLRNVYNSTLHY